LADSVVRVVLSSGLPTGLALYHTLRSSPVFYVTERQLNAAGYQLLAAKRPRDAVGLFQLVVEEHPRSANAFDSLGEAYAAAGEKALALKSYRRSLKLDPTNDNARQQIHALQR
jgi:cytochrome c-type biogenesis protein CcmH/NrfG